MSGPISNETRARTIFADYDRFVVKAEAYAAAGDDEAAAAYAAIAAHSALQPHAGFFVSPRLERLLVSIGARHADSAAYARPADCEREIGSILHVATEVAPVGGLTNMLRNWIDADATRRHSLALTRQRGAVPVSLAETIAKRGGRIARLNRGVGAQIAWAKRLRALARGYDAVVLHAYSYDVIPTLAFAVAGAQPPVLLLNHGDHLFWLGAATSDVVINLRDVAQDLAIARRAIEPRRNVMAPTIVAPAKRTRTREAAKAELGLPADTILMLSAARAIKYMTQNGVSFADTHVALLSRYPNAQLWVLGTYRPDDWNAAKQATQGRIRSFPEIPDTRVYFEAADIYVDSFPFVSSTSMMEAAGLGLPLVSRFYGPKDARIFAINHPGIDAPTLHGRTEQEYLAQLDRLLADPKLRAAKGEEARQAVLHYHTPPSWLGFIEVAYALATRLAPIDPTAVFANGETEDFSFGEPDCRLYEVFGFADTDPDALIKAHLGAMPTPARLAAWRDLRRRHRFAGAGEAARQLLPEWLIRTLKP